MSSFQVSDEVTLDASGNGTLTFRPSGRTWKLTRAFMQVQNATTRAVSNTNEAQGTVYIGSLAATSLVGNTIVASTGDTAVCDETVTDGTPIYVVFTGGDVGAIGVTTIGGMQDDPEGGFRAV